MNESESNPDSANSSPSVQHACRQAFGQTVAGLVRQFGLEHLKSIEDAVCLALQESVVLAQDEQRSPDSPPKQPRLDIHHIAQQHFLTQLTTSSPSLPVAAGEVEVDETALQTDSLGLLFACCHPDVSLPDRVTLVLKSLCGFNVDEIARALLLSCETIEKRLDRARETLIKSEVEVAIPSPEELAQRLDEVQQSLHLMFSEGFGSPSSVRHLRYDMCEEAARLCQLLLQHPDCQTPATHALLANMLFLGARLGAQVEDQGWLLLLAQQDRSQWDHQLIQAATHHLNRSAMDEEISQYQLEAAIAWHHTQATSFADTDWPTIQRLYNLLWLHWPSPLYRLNTSVAQSYVEGPEAALQTLETLVDHSRLRLAHWLPATRAEMHQRLGQRDLAAQALREALANCQSPSQLQMLQQRLTACEADQ